MRVGSWSFLGALRVVGAKTAGGRGSVPSDLCCPRTKAPQRLQVGGHGGRAAAPSRLGAGGVRQGQHLQAGLQGLPGSAPPLDLGLAHLPGSEWRRFHRRLVWHLQPSSPQATPAPREPRPHSFVHPFFTPPPTGALACDRGLCEAQCSGAKVPRGGRWEGRAPRPSSAPALLAPGKPQCLSAWSLLGAPQKDEWLTNG